MAIGPAAMRAIFRGEGHGLDRDQKGVVVDKVLHNSNPPSELNGAACRQPSVGNPLWELSLKKERHFALPKVTSYPRGSTHPATAP